MKWVKGEKKQENQVARKYLIDFLEPRRPQMRKATHNRHTTVISNIAVLRWRDPKELTSKPVPNFKWFIPPCPPPPSQPVYYVQVISSGGTVYHSRKWSYSQVN